MSLFNKATFVLIPSGVEAGKVFAEKPIDGDGDLTWSRNSTATRTNSSGVIESVGANVPRLSYLYGSCPAALLEPQRTNLALWSEDFSNANWIQTNTTITSNSTTAPDGSSTADLLIGNGLSAIHFTVIPINITSGIVYTLSCFVKKDTNNFIQLAFNNYFGLNAWGNFDLNNGVVGSVGSSATARIQDVGNGWYRCSITATSTSSGGGNTLGIILVNSASAVGFQTNTLSTSVYIWGAQIEQGAYATTYIPTSRASATRLADTFIRNNIYTNGLISASGGTWFVELKNNVVYTRDNSGVNINLDDSSGFNNGFLIRNSGGTARLSISKVIGGTNTNLYTTITDTVKLAIKWNGTTADVFVNGTKQVSATAFTTLQLQNLISGIQQPTFIQQMALFNSPLSDTDCEVITGTSYDSYSAMATALGYTII